MKSSEFWSRVRKDVDGCWEWLGWKSDKGYGLVYLGKRKYTRAHRVAWELVNGPIPGDLIVRHFVCNNPSCVRVDHLRLGSQVDNMRDMVEAGRSARGDRSGRRKHPDRYPPPRTGEAHHSHLRPECVARGERAGTAKLTEDIVRDVRRRLAGGESQRSVARAVGVTQANVWAIAKGKTWRHVV